MFSNITNSLRDNLIQKATNPFLGTFAIVWIVRNWKFVYSLFYFDSTFKLNDRINAISEYFKDYDFWSFLVTVLLTLLVMLFTYVMLNVSRLIVNFFDKIVSPQIYKITDKSSIVLKSDYQKLEQQISTLEAKVQEERESRLKAQNENEALEKRIAELLSRTNEPDQIQPPVSQQPKRTKTLDAKKKDSKAELIFNKLKTENKLKDFEDIASDILNGETLQKGREIVRESSKIGLIEPGNYSGPPDWYNYKLTPTGKEIHEILLMEQLKSG
ncbi:MAG: hypothetical protein RIF36_24945 [Imperialibacter sp.]|uniref:hypothetical protein n=1 Tax=Imperialibacter sp. TaxID=2038411 RepID=UPI0032F081CE